MDIAIHANLSIPWQLRYSDAFIKGVPGSRITTSPNESADIHICLGPHFSKWRTDNTILVDRCFWRGDPQHVSIAWIKNGERVFTEGKGKKPPRLKPGKTGNKTIFLADYNGQIEQADTVRLHPAQEPQKDDLITALSKHDIAIGYETSALVTAALEGLKVICKSPHHIMNQPNWLELLAYSDWSINEIYSGEAWQHLKRSRGQLKSL